MIGPRLGADVVEREAPAHLRVVVGEARRGQRVGRPLGALDQQCRTPFCFQDRSAPIKLVQRFSRK